jgi:hypothetical protein
MEKNWLVNVYFKDDGGKEPTEFHTKADSQSAAESNVRSDCRSMGWTDIVRMEATEEC